MKISTHTRQPQQWRRLRFVVGVSGSSTVFCFLQKKMSWKASLSRYLPCLRFFACPDSPSSKGVMTYYARNLEELMLLNPGFPLMMRTTDNAMPAVTTELEWTTQDLLRFMIQTGRFRNLNGTLAEDRIEAAKAYLAMDWDQFLIYRFKSPKFDPERPFLDKEDPGWKDRPAIKTDLEPYFAMKRNMEEQVSVFQSGPNDEYTRAENALLMCQRVDLWCAGPKEVERAVQHLYKLGRKLNEREPDFPAFIAEFVPGCDDMEDV